MSTQVDENVAFVGPLRLRFRECCSLLDAQSPQYKFILEWGANVVHGFNPVATPPSGSVEAFNKLVSHIRAFRPGVNVRLDAGTNIVIEQSSFLPLLAPSPAYPYGDERIPDPYKLPIQCIPCLGKIYTARA